MILNLEYFKNEKSTFNSIKKETDIFVQVFENYIKNNDKKITFEDFISTLVIHLTNKKFSERKIKKWLNYINANIQSLAKNIHKDKNGK